MAQSDHPAPPEQLVLGGLLVIGALDALVRVTWPVLVPAAAVWLLHRLARRDPLHSADGGRP